MGPKREVARDVGLAWLRVLAGALIATHGYGKLFSGSMPEFVNTVAQMGLPGEPATLAQVAAWAEFAGGLLCVLGLLTRVAALLIAGTVGAAFFVHHAGDAFQVKELALLYLVAFSTLVLTGPGRFSIDAAIEMALRPGGSKRRALLELLLGAWLALSLCVVAGAVLSFGVAHSEGDGTDAARRQAAAFNVQMFAGSGRAQLVLAGACVLVAAWPRRRSRVVAGAVVGAGILAAVLALAIVPRASALASEAVATGPTSAASLEMKRQHRLVAALDLAKVALLVVAALATLREPRPRD